MQHLIDLVKTSDKPVYEVVEHYFNSVLWSVLKSEWNRLTRQERLALINKLSKERK